MHISVKSLGECVMNYHVGQILYLLSSKTMKVIPAQVVEELTKKSMKGQEINYTVMMPNKDRSQVTLSSLDVKTFTDLGDCKHFMMINAERSINKVLNDTQKVSKIFTMDTEKQVEEEVEEVEEVEEEIIKEENVQNNESESIISIDMGEGMKARIQTSELEKLKQ
jgi:uncharacterized cupredoxin-like copper-binding protein